MEAFLFGLLGITAIASAAAMILSRNAVHSALFLIANFGCVALLFLMLDAPFISMVQIAVYAGAIMVLFLFVIMLLGAEQANETTQRFPWVARAAVILGISFLFAMGTPLLLSGFDLPEPAGDDPLVRVVHAANVTSGAAQAPVDVTISGETLEAPLVIENLAFSDVTDFIAVPAGNYVVDLSTDEGVFASLEAELEAGVMVSAVAYGEVDVTPEEAAATEADATEVGTSDEMGEAEASADTDTSDAATTDEMATIVEEPAGLPFGVALVPNSMVGPTIDGARVQVLNLYSTEPQALVNLGADRVVDAERDIVTFAALAYGEVSESVQLIEGDYPFAFYPADNIGDETASLLGWEVEPGTEQTIILVPDYSASPDIDGFYRARVLDRDQDTLVLDTADTFGNPRDIGLLLFTSYLLPVNLVGFLLLVGLIGVIVLTRPEGEKRPRRTNRRRKVSRPLVSVISQQTGSDVSVDTPRLEEGE